MTRRPRGGLPRLNLPGICASPRPPAEYRLPAIEMRCAARTICTKYACPDPFCHHKPNWGVALHSGTNGGLKQNRFRFTAFGGRIGCVGGPRRGLPRSNLTGNMRRTRQSDGEVPRRAWTLSTEGDVRLGLRLRRVVILHAGRDSARTRRPQLKRSRQGIPAARQSGRDR